MEGRIDNRTYHTYVCMCVCVRAGGERKAIGLQCRPSALAPPSRPSFYNRQRIDLNSLFFKKKEKGKQVDAYFYMYVFVRVLSHLLLRRRLAGQSVQPRAMPDASAAVAHSTLSVSIPADVPEAEYESALRRVAADLHSRLVERLVRRGGSE